jgi:DNA (cytosine-5)-methyltransferase 1
MARRRKAHVIDLFAGCGGLSLGLEAAGFEPILFSEINKDAADTYALNRRDRVQSVPDVRNLSNSLLDGLRQDWRDAGIRDVDLVVGGPPCQGYSGIGHRRSHDVSRRDVPSNHLFKEMIRVIEAVRPRIFLFENVRGLLSGRWTPSGLKGEIWADVLSAFEDIGGYDVRPALVQAKNYGVPQNRPRVLIAGIRRDLGWRPDSSPCAVANGLLPFGNVDAPDLIDVIGDLVDDDFASKSETVVYPHGAQSDFQREMRSRRGGPVLRKGARLTEHYYSKHSVRVREKFEYMLSHSGAVSPRMRTKKFAQRLLLPRWTEAGPNITATSLSDDFVHYSQPRTLTVREWARLQCFPDWYQFRGPRTTGGIRRAGNPTEGVWDREAPKYTQIGNAVPVRLARAIGTHLMGFID